MRITKNHPTPKSGKKAINRVAHKVFVSIGSNVDREENILAGLAALREHFGDLQLSSIYESVPIGIEGAENYYNLVAGFETDLSPVQINNQLKKIEKKTGRRDKRNCPLDIDLLLFDDLVDRSFELDIPREDINDYAYVAIPLSEIAGDHQHPETGKLFKETSNSASIANQEIWLSEFQHHGEK